MKSNRLGWGFLSPTLIILAITGFLPFLYVLYIGFFDWNIFAAQKGLIYTGANNYRRLVFDVDFLRSLWYTIKFTFWAVSSELVLGFALAQLLTKDFPGKTFFRIIHALGELDGQALPLLQTMIEIVCDDAPVEIPWDAFFAA